MAVVTYACIYDTDTEGHFEPLAVVFVFYGSMWAAGVYLQYFEYKRGLPHAWYAHQMFWVLAALFNIGRFIFLIIVDGLLDFTEFNGMNREQKIKNIVVFPIKLVLTMGLAYLGIKYKREFP